MDSDAYELAVYGDDSTLLGGDCDVPMPMRERNVKGNHVCRLHQTHEERYAWENIP
jgi:hypothetical protein